MGNGSNASPTTVADKYSGDSAVGGVYNIHPDMNITSVNVSYGCITGSPASTFNMPPCVTYTTSPGPGCASGCNAIQVIEKATVPTFFAKLFGVTSLKISATASATASGALPLPYHILMVLDTTASMGSGTDTGCAASGGGSYSPEQCAQLGAQTLLSYLAPCAANLSSCGSNPPVDEVGLMTFPGICSDTANGVTTANCPKATTLTNTTADPTYAPDDYTCPAKDPPIAAYNNDPEYLVIAFQNNYRASDAATTLDFSAPLVETVGAGTDSCGMPTPGGEGTFYAGAIIAAQQYLTANHTSGIQDIMILLSDGNASASSTQMGGSVKQTVTISGMSGGLFSPTAECAQAVAAANYAKTTKQSDGTSSEIYSVSYGSETSGCTTGDTLTPCETMSGIASLPLSQYFFSVPQTINGKTSTVCSGAVSITVLNQVFTSIAGQLMGSRFIPNNVF